eukprot:TRINITY_DN399_c0_g1_i1.p1 TRINITY_DN399_c0_g1~~TRINITY_DN399_c0_g1_i1.p1  ORF type:complete len:454 (+),score=73.06 TRINITY_DN399_c0_g1_i1:55-1362(+)
MSTDVEFKTLSVRLLPGDVESKDESLPDFDAGHGHDVSTTKSLPLIWMNIFKSFVGAGLLSMPYACYQGGYVAMPAGLLFIVVISAHAMLLMVDCKDNLPKGYPPTYEAIGYAAFGKLGMHVVTWSVVITQCGFCCAYVVFIGQNMNHLVPSIAFKAWPFIILPIFAFLSWIRHLKYLAPFNTLANGCIAFGVLAICIVIGMYMRVVPDLPPVQPINYAGFPVFIGIAVFAFEGVGLVIPIEASVENKAHFKPLFLSCLAAIMCLLIFVGEFVYVILGANVSSLITRSIPASPLTTAITAALCIALLISFALQLFPVTQIAERTRWYLFISRRFPTIVQLIFRTALCALLCGVAVALGNSFGLFVSLVGSLGGSMMAFILPSLFHWRICLHGKGSGWKHNLIIAKDFLLAFFGFSVGMVLGTTITLMNIARGDSQ